MYVGGNITKILFSRVFGLVQVLLVCLPVFLSLCVPRAPHCSREMCKVSTDFSTCAADVAF